MGRISDAQIESIRQRADIVAVVGERVSLQKKGRDFIGCCPFHDEKTPSFSVNPQKQAWYCHGACKKGGNVITFVMESESLKFPEAVRFLAKRFGVQIEDETPEERARSKRKADLLEALNRAVDFYKKQLATGKTESAAQARALLERRGVREETIAAFSLGVAPKGDLLARKASEVRGMLPLLRELGLVRGDGRDFFSNRLLFPIADESGRWVGFGGRRLDEEEMPKFKNSSETPGIFEKKKLLYGLNWTREARPKPDRLVVVEGYMDVVIAQQAGCTNVVGALSVGFTREHVSLAKRFGEGRVVVLFDGDAAGRKASVDRLKELLETDLEVRVATLPDKTDPDDYILKEGKDAFDKLATAGSQDGFEYLVEQVIKKEGLGSRNGVAECAQLLGRIQDEIRYELALKQAVRRLGFPEETLRRVSLEAREANRKAVRPGPGAAQEALREQDVVENTHPQVREMLGPHACAGEPVEVALLEGLLTGEPLPDGSGVSAEDFTPGPLREVALAALAGPNPLDRLHDRAMALGVATRLIARASEHPGKNWKAEVEGGARALVARRNRARAEQLVAEIEQANARGDFDLVGRLLAEKTRLAREAR